jgi:hypothetical protein
VINISYINIRKKFLMVKGIGISNVLSSQINALTRVSLPGFGTPH